MFLLILAKKTAIVGVGCHCFMVVGTAKYQNVNKQNTSKRMGTNCKHNNNMDKPNVSQKPCLKGKYKLLFRNIIEMERKVCNR